ncbi:uncharacterized protein LOC101179310 [Nomascus leucogenys]|uniref:uncharacterized protein LOC101179310 n=1 Tax=Nomascus leucogenys TaxID=61853 RepID=UPI00122DAB34|nr:uncharacterized protein LOC101179310 [Nomascus leucogenys]
MEGELEEDIKLRGGPGGLGPTPQEQRKQPAAWMGRGKTRPPTPSLPEAARPLCPAAFAKFSEFRLQYCDPRAPLQLGPEGLKLLLAWHGPGSFEDTHRDKWCTPSVRLLRNRHGEGSCTEKPNRSFARQILMKGEKSTETEVDHLRSSLAKLDRNLECKEQLL